MSARAVLLSLMVAAIAASGVVIAQCNRGPRIIATLTAIGAGSAERADGGAPWTPAAAGDRFGDGDAVRTGAGSEATLEFGGGMILGMGPSTTIRFGDRLSIDGEISNDSARELVLTLEEGTSRIGPRSTVRFSTGASGRKQITLVIGEATFQRPGAGEQALVRDVVLVVAESTSRLIDAAPAAIDAAPSIDAAPPIDAAIERASVVMAQVSGRIRVTEPGAEPRTLRAGDHEIPAGSVISVPRRGQVVLSREGETATVSGRAEAVVAPEGALLELERGAVTVAATAIDATIALPGGTAIARAGRGRGEIRVSRQSSRITPRAGRFEVVGEGVRETAQIGEWIKLSRRGTIEVYGRQPRFADFAIPAGESASIHDPGAPTAVRIRFDDRCPRGGVIEAGRGRAKRLARGERSSILLLEPGRYRYALRCIEDEGPGDAVASGRLRIDRRRGTKPLPIKAASNTVDADGLSYRIKYQNLLPNITFRWPDAPSGSYTLTLSSKGERPRTYKTNGPTHTIRSGELPEGTYRFRFEGKNSRSEEGVIIIAFDNASTSGYLRSPRIGASWNGSTVEVEGAGITGSRVSVNGKRLALDQQRRFEARVTKPDQGALAVRFSHPRRGIHYYVRRNGRR